MEKQIESIFTVIAVLCRHPAITDTLWIPDRGSGVTVVEELYLVCGQLGATDEQIEEHYANVMK